MTESTNTQSELDSLKERATTMGIDFHPSIGVDKLRAKVNEALEADKPSEEEENSADKARKEAAALKRVNIVCMNPAKKEWPGEIFITGNRVIGTYRKFVQFNTTEGYHIPKVIYDLLKTKKFQMFKTETTKNGIAKRVGHLAAEFAIEDLPPLTKEELAELAKSQAARG